jgi:hypothetical protein
MEAHVKLTGILLSLATLASGCATIINDANGQRARIDVTSDGFAQAKFSDGDYLERHRIGDCALLVRSQFRPPWPNPNSGPIQIAADGEPVTLMPQYHGWYRESDRRKQPIWQPGQMVVVSAPGHTAPPFRVELNAPTFIDTIDPPREDANLRGPQIWALRDFPLRWTPVDGATLVVQIIQPDLRVRCEFDARRGSAIVPQALISELPLGDASLYISSMVEKNVDAQGWQIRVRAYTDVVREHSAYIDAQLPTGPHGEE